MDKAYQERQTMMKIKPHKNICRYIDSFISTKDGYKLYLVMEYCDKGDLAQYLKRLKTMSNNFALADNKNLALVNLNKNKK